MGEKLPVQPDNSPLFSLITCTRCHQLMDSPKELDCGHMFCKECLPVVNTEVKGMLLRQISVVCWDCSKFTHIRGKEIEKLPQAPWVQLLKTFLGSSSSVASGLSKEDTLCSGCKNPTSNSWCQDCDILLCQTCASSHIRLRKMDHHKILNKSQVMEESRNMTCPDHGDSMKLLCEDCPRLLCFQCIHQQQCVDHNYAKISNLVKSKTSKIQGILGHIESECNKLSEFKSSLDLYEEDKISLFEENKEKVISDITQKIELLQNAKIDMLKKIEEKRSDFNQNIKDLRVSIDEKRKEYEVVKDVIQTVSLPSHQIELVLACPLLEKRINVDELSQYRVREQIDDFTLIYKEGNFEVPNLSVKPWSLSPKRSPRVFNMNPNSLYGTNLPNLDEPKDDASVSTVQTEKAITVFKRPPKRSRELFIHVPPPLPDRNGKDEVDKTVADSDSSSSEIPLSPSDSGVVTPELLTPVCNSIIEVARTEKKKIDPSVLPAALPRKPASENSIFYIERPNCRTKGYAVVNESECEHPLPPSDKPITWESIKMEGGFEVLSLPNGNVLVSFENGVKMYGPDGHLLKNQTVLGAKGMAYRPMKRDILVAGYHSNRIFALHDSSLTFKADLSITMKKAERPWSCAALSNGGFVVLYSKEDKYFFLDFYDKDDKFVKSSECGLIAKGPLRMTTDAKDLIFISDETNNQVVICYPNENYIQPVIVDSPRGMACTPNERGVFFSSNKSICQLKLSPRDGRFSDEKVTELPIEVKSVANYKDKFICLTSEDLRLVSKF